jgi:hypothetical protein
LNPGKAEQYLYPNEAKFNSYIERQSEKQMNVIGHEYESVQEIMPFASIPGKNLKKAMCRKSRNRSGRGDKSCRLQGDLSG